nr:alpha-L-rhamnosidase [uncultured Schaedlerella sp.]
MLRLEQLKCEHLKNPLGIESRHPVFSWILTSEEKNVLQTACQVQVYAGEALLWDSGELRTDNSIACVYGGPKLKVLGTYRWRVTVWDNQGNEACAEAVFTMARLEQPWRASWVEPEQQPAYGVQGDSSDAETTMGISTQIRGLDEYEGFQPVQYLRIPFAAEKKVKRALLCATAHGVYELSVNGEAPDDRLLAPELSSYQKILQYQIYDVTELVHQGKNVICAKLGDGWWTGRVGFIGNACQFGDTTAFLLEGQIEYEDGSVDYVLSDSAVSATGPLLVADLFVGEKYDARKELAGWENPEFDDSHWKPVKKKTYPMDHLRAQDGEPIRVIKSFTPKAVLTDPNGDTILDLGQNIAGFLSFSVEAEEGRVIRLEHTEVLDREGRFCKNIMGVNKDQMDVYITKEGRQTYRPVFTYHGFRYVRISGWPGKPSAEDFTAHVVSTDTEDIGFFETSDPELNRLQANIWWSQVANTVGIPTDCPQREKAGWAGDVGVYAPTMCFLRNEEVFLQKWLRNCRAEQQEHGEIPTVVPFLKCYKEMNQYYGTDTSCGWGDVIVMVPWYLYRAYGNRQVLEENYPAMKKWMQYVQHCAETEVPEGFEEFDEVRKARQKYLWNTGFHYGDWLVPSMVLNTTDDMAMINTAYATKEVVAPAYYAFSTDLMRQIAEVLGETEDAAYYSELNKKIRWAFMEEYVEKDGRIQSDMQGIYVLALKLRLVSEDIRPKVEARLLEKIAENGGCLDTGFLSVPFLLDVLTENGNREAAYQLLYQKKCPSWLYEVEKGATTIWESWGATSEDGEIGKYSYNHYAYGCVGDWMYRELAGIQIEEAGYHKARIAPSYDCGLEYVKGSLRTPYGTLQSVWEKKGEAVYLEVRIPVNTSAAVILPDGREVQVGSGTWRWNG